LGQWYESIGKRKIERLSDVNNHSSDLASPQPLAYLLIEFERHIPFERLNPQFLTDRRDWIANLLDCERFEDAIAPIKKLSAAIREPPFFTLAMKALTEESEMFRHAPLDVCFLIMEFVVDTGDIVESCKSMLLNDSKLPIFSTASFHSLISEISRFGYSTKQLASEFVGHVEVVERARVQELEDQERQRKKDKKEVDEKEDSEIMPLFEGLDIPEQVNAVQQVNPVQQANPVNGVQQVNAQAAIGINPQVPPLSGVEQAPGEANNEIQAPGEASPPPGNPDSQFHE